MSWRTSVCDTVEFRARRRHLDIEEDFGDHPLGDRRRLTRNLVAGRAQCLPTDAPADVHLSLDVLASLYLGSHRASAFDAANRLHSNDSGLIARLDAAFAGDVTAELGYGF
jgi:predicted acetyltransferase